MNFDELFLQREILRSKPDFLIYAPHSTDEVADHGNEHLHVFRSKDGALCALWTMSKYEATYSQRPMFSKSFNGGLSWTTPKCLLQAPINPENGCNMGSWATPLISKSGRIYVLYSKHLDMVHTHEQGCLTVMYSDDSGETWAKEAPLPNIPHSIYDPTSATIPASGLPWQRPLRCSNGDLVLGVSRNHLQDGVPKAPHGVWMEHPVSCEFIRFDNIDDDPEIADMKTTFMAQGEAGLGAPLPNHPECISGEEPSLVELPDNRLMCVMRTAEGHVWYSVSEDFGATWRKTEMLRYTDGGKGVEHPLSPCPMFRVSETEYVIYIHNLDGYFGTDAPRKDGNWRNPIYMLKGEFRPGAHQPVWFSDPVLFYENGDVSIERNDLAMYADLTIENGEPILWYPDRKFFLLGKRIPRTLLAGISVPK